MLYLNENNPVTKMSRERTEAKRSLIELIEKFREKGATSPDKAMTLEEFGLPPGFEYLMHGHLGKLGIFLEKDGKYYLSEERLTQLRERTSVMQTARHSRKNLLTLRMIRIMIGIIFISLLLVNIYVNNLSIRITCSILLLALLAISIIQLYYLIKVRKEIRPLAYEKPAHLRKILTPCLYRSGLIDSG